MRASSAHAAEKCSGASRESVWYSVLARGQETIHVDAERVHRRVCAREDRELSPQIQSRGSRKRGSVRA